MLIRSRAKGGGMDIFQTYIISVGVFYARFHSRIAGDGLVVAIVILLRLNIAFRKLDLFRGRNSRNSERNKNDRQHVKGRQKSRYPLHHFHFPPPSLAFFMIAETPTVIPEIRKPITTDQGG